MMIFLIKLLLSTVLVVNSMAYCMDTITVPNLEKGPMNDEWFYDTENPYCYANEFLQQKKWVDAEKEYLKKINESVGTVYDQQMARINLASARMAQKKHSKSWEPFAQLCGITDDRLLTKKQLDRLREGETVVVHTSKIGIGDIVHFLPVVKMLKKLGIDVRLAVRSFMHKPLDGPSKVYATPLIDEKDADKTEGWQTHIMSLYGLLNVKPSDLASDRVIYTVQEKAISRVKKTIDFCDGRPKTIVFLGEERQATLMGGKQLPRDTKRHGRCLDAKAFEQLLKKKGVVLLDCNPERCRIKFGDSGSDNLTMSPEFENKVLALPSEEAPFDSVIALGLIFNKNKDCVGYAADNGPPNLFSRVLDLNAQRRFAFVIPNADEYDMRMEGEGQSYQQMLSNCNVYRCDNPGDQADTIVMAYKQMTGE